VFAVSCTLQVSRTLWPNHVPQDLHLSSALNTMATAASTTISRATGSVCYNKRRRMSPLTRSERRTGSRHEDLPAVTPAKAKNPRWHKNRRRPRRTFTVHRGSQTDMSMGTGEIKIETSFRFITQVKAERYDFDLVFGRTKEAATSTSPTRAGRSLVDRPPETADTDRSSGNMQSICNAMTDLCCEDKEIDDWGIESNIGWD
jgi:hypothetical protein